MKINSVIKKFSFIMITSFVISSIAVGGGVSVGLTYNFSSTSGQSFVNQYNDKFKSESTSLMKFRVTGFNETHMNYTESISETSNSYASLQEGNWFQQDSNTKSESYSSNTINLTQEMNKFFISFDLQDNPTWNPSWDQSYLDQNYQGLNYQSRFAYFDQKNESNPDQISILYNIPNIIDSSNIQKFIQFMEARITDRIKGTVNSFQTLYFNASSFLINPSYNSLYSSWYTWINQNLKQNVAYSINLIDTNQGVYKITPQWIGRFNFLGSLHQLDPQTGFNQVREPFLTSTNFPLNYDSYASQYSLSTQLPSLYSLNSINEKLSDLSKYISVTTSGTSLNIDVSTLYEEPPSTGTGNSYYYYPYSPSHFNNLGKQITGIFTFNLKLQYDSNGFLIKEDINSVYNGGSYGTYSIYYQFSQAQGSNNNLVNTNLIIELAVIPVSLGSGIGLAYFLKKRK